MTTVLAKSMPVIETISKDDQVALMDRMIKEQPAEATTTEETSSSFL